VNIRQQFPVANEKYGDPRSPRRQHLVKHLVDCGDRSVLEALLAVEEGQPLDWVLEDFGRIHPDTFAAIGADVVPVDTLILRRVS
jgi:hypothetical protein